MSVLINKYLSAKEYRNNKNYTVYGMYTDPSKEQKHEKFNCTLQFSLCFIFPSFFHSALHYDLKALIYFEVRHCRHATI